MPKGRRGGRRSGSAVIQKANAPIDADKAGVNFRQLSPTFQQYIQRNMTLSNAMEQYVKNGDTNLFDEWTVGFKGAKEKRKVLTSFDGKQIHYTMKDKNKILLKTTNKNQVANKVAEFLNKELKNGR